MKKRAEKQPPPTEPAGDNWANPFKDLKISLPPDNPPPPPPPAAETVAPPRKLSREDQALLKAFGGDVASSASADGTPGAPFRRGPALTFAIQRKGKGGKTVTLVRGLQKLSMEEQMTLCAEARSGLGCGGRFVEGTLELQGDLRERAAAWFQQRGFNIG